MANPYLAGSPEFLEYEVWETGQLKGGVERDFLRAFHSPYGVQQLQTCVQAATGSPTRVTSMWIDRYPLVYPSLPATPDARELADLAVVVRVKGSSGAFRERMLLLQGKIDGASWTSSGSSPKEIDLLEKVPAFELLTSSKPRGSQLGIFHLQNDFGAPPYSSIPFWAYLLFAPSGSTSVGMTPSHAYAAWPSSVAFKKSLFPCVIEQTKACIAGLVPGAGPSPAFPPWGADVDRKSPCKEWRRLYVTLAAHVHRKVVTKLTGGKWKNIAPFSPLFSAAYPAISSGAGASIGFVSTGFSSRMNPMTNEHANALAFEFCKMSRRDLFLEDVGSWYHDIDAADSELLQGGGGDDLGGGRLDATDEGAGFGMIYIDVSAEPDERGQRAD